MRSVMSRNGRSTSAPSWTIRMRPACSATNSRPDPSPGSATSTGDLRPPTTVVTTGFTAWGSNAATEPAGDAHVEGDAAALDPGAVAALDGDDRGVRCE